jgi:AhpC/TSA family
MGAAPRLLFTAVALTLLPTFAAATNLQIGQPAPDFTGAGSNGETVHIADLKGKMVVLEWTNDGCPYVGKWYRSGAMQQLQRDASAVGAVWLTVVSSRPGEQGYVDAAKANEDTASPTRRRPTCCSIQGAKSVIFTVPPRPRTFS